MILTPYGDYRESAKVLPDDLLSIQINEICTTAYQILDPSTGGDDNGLNISKWGGYGTSLCAFGLCCAERGRQQGFDWAGTRIKMLAALQYLMAETGQSIEMPHWMWSDGTFVEDQKTVLSTHPELAELFPHANDSYDVGEQWDSLQRKPKKSAVPYKSGYDLKQFDPEDADPSTTAIWLNRRSGFPSLTWLRASSNLTVPHMVEREVESIVSGAELADSIENEEMDGMVLEAELHSSMLGLDRYFHWVRSE